MRLAAQPLPFIQYASMLPVHAPGLDGIFRSLRKAFHDQAQGHALPLHHIQVNLIRPDLVLLAQVIADVEVHAVHRQDHVIIDPAHRHDQMLVRVQQHSAQPGHELQSEPGRLADAVPRQQPAASVQYAS